MAASVKSKKSTNKEPAPEAKRAYRSERRTQQARETRRVIRDAARRLFQEHGYAGTSIASIAEEAGVAPETVYATFKNKRALLLEIEDTLIVGDDAEVPLFARPYVEEARKEPNQRRRLRILMTHGLHAVARSAQLADVVHSAAASDPELAAVYNERKRARHGDVRRFVGLVAEAGPLKLDFDEAVDVTYALTGPEIYNLLVGDLGWSMERYIDVLCDIMDKMALSPR
jgi:AcrR family transcriptional regulator